MKFGANLVEGRLIRRYKRFLADIQLPGEVITRLSQYRLDAGLLRARQPRVALGVGQGDAKVSPHLGDRRGRKGDGGHQHGPAQRAGGRGDRLGAISELAGYASVRREVAFGEERSRVDLVLEDPARAPCYVEVKNVTAAASGGVALFPDCVSDRGARHLRELMRIKSAGLRPVQLYCVQRGDVDEVRPADAIDPE
jgi:sugar fermentation stimulation protein A